MRAVSALRRNADNIIDLVSMMGRDSKMPCYGAGVAQVVNTLRQRFQLQLSAEEAENFVETDMVGKSLGSYYTRLYVSASCPSSFSLFFSLFSLLFPFSSVPGALLSALGSLSHDPLTDRPLRKASAVACPLLWLTKEIQL